MTTQLQQLLRLVYFIDRNSGSSVKNIHYFIQICGKKDIQITFVGGPADKTRIDYITKTIMLQSIL